MPQTTKETPHWMLGCAIFWVSAVIAFGQANTNATLAAQARQAFDGAQKEFATHPDDASAASQLGRASYDWAEFSTNTTQRATAAQAGIDACKHLVARDAKSAPGHYYLAMCYGELAEAKAPSLAAYRLIREIEGEFKTATDLDEHLDYGGPPRCLGLLYRDAPGWPLSIGNEHNAHEYLERAAALAPDFPENQMNLLESSIQWHEAAEAETAWQKLATLWPAARTNLTGRAWEYSWADWTYRRAVAKEQFEKTFKHAVQPFQVPP